MDKLKAKTQTRELDINTYQELQALAKEHDIPANQSRNKLIEALEAKGVSFDASDVPSWFGRILRKAWDELQELLTDVRIKVFFEGNAWNIEVCYRGQCWTVFRKPVSKQEIERVLLQIRNNDKVGIKRNKNIRRKSRLLKATSNLRGKDLKEYREQLEKV